LENPLVNNTFECYKNYPKYYLNETMDKNNKKISLLKKCDLHCDNCTSIIDCTRCEQNYYFLEDAEKGKEKICYFKGNYTEKHYVNIREHMLKLCDENCNQCIENKFDCIVCKEGFYKKYKPIIEEEKNRCHDPNKNLDFFLNKVTNLLEKCDISCLTCDKNVKNCIKCNYNFFNKENNPDNINGCFNDTIIEEGFFLNDNKLFSKCNDMCSKCAIKSENCLGCNNKKDYFKYDHKKIKSSVNVTKINNMTYAEFSKLALFCVKKDEKISGIFFDKEKKEFNSCLEGCKFCENSEECKECDSENGFVYIKTKNWKEGDRNLFF